MCRRPGAVYSAVVASESSEDISPSVTACGYSSNNARRRSRKPIFSGRVLL
ncbi:hypothetical protein D3C71_2207640 [compost metagenome]